MLSARPRVTVRTTSNLPRRSRGLRPTLEGDIESAGFRTVERIHHPFLLHMYLLVYT